MKLAVRFVSAALLLILLTGCQGAGLKEIINLKVHPLGLNEQAVTLAVGSVYQLVPTVQNVSWKSSNEAVATVSSAGIVTGVSQGLATITATANGGSTSQCSVIVASLYIPGGAGGYPVYWKDGTLVFLSGTTGYNAAMMVVSGSDVHVAGIRGSDGSPVYWKNGAMVSLTGLPSNISWWYTGMAASGGNVYITATADTGTNHISGYWVNGSWTPCSGIASSSDLTGVAVAGGHAYIAGTDRSAVPGGPAVPVYWVDGTKHVLPEGNDPNGNPNVSGYITAAPVVSGGDVFIAGTTYGSTGDVPIVWKNGQILFLGTSGWYHVEAMAVCGNDVYLAGSTDSANSTTSSPCSAVFWKNGSLTTLPYGAPQASATTIAAGKDVYVAGKPAWPWPNSIDPRTPLFWKNGSSSPLQFVGSDTIATIRALVAVGDDVFLFGTTGTGPISNGSLNYSNPTHPVFWENGVLNQLPLGGFGGGDVGWPGPFVSLP